jgi:KDO2-lipid IV(A) lauroyltransferase
MKFLIYILVYPLIWVISILPFRLLFTLSDFLFIILFYLIGYRKKVVLTNLSLAFPDKTTNELLKIRRKFYRHFIDIFMEMIKSFTISKKQLDRRFSYTNPEFLKTLYKDGKSIIIVGSHYGNWEWLFGVSPFVNYKCYAAFTRVNNPYFNRKIINSRSRFGLTLKQTARIIAEIDANVKNNVQAMYGLLSDQSPQLKKTIYWGKFLGVTVPIHAGAEYLAKKHNLSLVYVGTKKIKRGHYETTFDLITKDPNNYSDFELTDIYLRKLESQIYEQPEYYFWTHRRFKHRNKAPVDSSISSN